MDAAAQLDGDDQPESGHLQPAANSHPRRRHYSAAHHRGHHAARYQHAHQGTHLSDRVRLLTAVLCGRDLQRPDEGPARTGTTAAVGASQSRMASERLKWPSKPNPGKVARCLIGPRLTPRTPKRLRNCTARKKCGLASLHVELLPNCRPSGLSISRDAASKRSCHLIWVKIPRATCNAGGRRTARQWQVYYFPRQGTRHRLL